MKISIITVSFNSSLTIRDTIESVLNQTYTEIEYIIVDGLSSDNTIDIVREYETKFNGRLHWISEPDKGLYDAMNKGIQMSSGDVIGIVNSDDFYNDKNVIEKIIHIFDTEKSLDAVFADLIFVSQDDTSKVERTWIIGKQKSFKSGWHPAHPTFIVKREVYEKYGFFNLKYKLAADFEIMLRFIEKNNIKIFYLNSYIVRMRLGGASTKGIKNIFYQNLECIDAFKINGIRINSVIYLIRRLIPKLFQIQNKEIVIDKFHIEKR